MKNTEVKNAGLENTGPKRMGGIHGTGKRRTKFPGLKTHDYRLLNVKIEMDKYKAERNICILGLYYKYNTPLQCSAIGRNAIHVKRQMLKQTKNHADVRTTDRSCL